MLISVTKKDFDYLKIQRGDLDHLSGDLDTWASAYQKKIQFTYRTIRNFLPEHCGSILDIGSGMGGIDVVLYKHYQEQGQEPEVHLLDGEEDDPRVLRHDRTFNNMSVALSFLGRNGVDKVSYSTPFRLARVKPFDLIVSFAAWCFHISPKTYLDFVLKHCHKDTVLILDVRRDGWRYDLERHFLVRTTVEIGKKYDRLVMKPKEGI